MVVERSVQLRALFGKLENGKAGHLQTVRKKPDFTVWLFLLLFNSSCGLADFDPSTDLVNPWISIEFIKFSQLLPNGQSGRVSISCGYSGGV